MLENIQTIRFRWLKFSAEDNVDGKIHANNKHVTISATKAAKTESFLFCEDRRDAKN